MNYDPDEKEFIYLYNLLDEELKNLVKKYLYYYSMLDNTYRFKLYEIISLDIITYLNEENGNATNY